MPKIRLIQGKWLQSGIAALNGEILWCCGMPIFQQIQSLSPQISKLLPKRLLAKYLRVSAKEAHPDTFSLYSSYCEITSSPNMLLKLVVSYKMSNFVNQKNMVVDFVVFPL